jgi:hypothetical protein
MTAELRRLRRALELTGLMDADRAELFSGPLPTNSWSLPAEAEISEDQLLWREPADPLLLTPDEHGDLPPDEDPRWMNRQAGLLNDFLGLADAPEEHIRAFALRWGVLGTCRHGLPSPHGSLDALPSSIWRLLRAPEDWPSVGTRGKSELVPVARRRGWFAEPLAHWRALSRRAGSILLCAAHLEDPHGRKNPLGPPPWNDLLDNYPWPQETGFASDVARLLLGWLVDGCLRVADVRVALGWPRSGPRPFLEARSPFAAVVLDLTLAVCRSNGFALCFSCGEPYLPRRRPSIGRRNYCPTCAEKGVPLRDAKRAQREREAERRLEEPDGS